LKTEGFVPFQSQRDDMNMKNCRRRRRRRRRKIKEEDEEEEEMPK